jgi:hypothetical protein
MPGIAINSRRKIYFRPREFGFGFAGSDTSQLFALKSGTARLAFPLYITGVKQGKLSRVGYPTRETSVHEQYGQVNSPCFQLVLT